MEGVLGSPKYKHDPRRRHMMSKKMLADSPLFIGLPKEVIKNLKKAKDFLPILMENLDEKYKK